MEMDERKIKILLAIVNDYINTAEPVGSRTIAKKYDLGISSATIRNEMADLEDMGYLEQLHTSSGRKPSDKGYRLYVDKLMQIPQLSPEEEFKIKTELLNAALHEAGKYIMQATSLLSELTKLTCIVKPPSVRKERIKSIQLINIDSSVLIVIVIDNSIVKNTIVRVKTPIKTEYLLKLSNLLNARLKNLTVEEINLAVINSIRNDLREHEDIFNAIIPALYESFEEAENTDVYLVGATNIFNYPEYNDIVKAKEFLSALDNKERLKVLLNEKGDFTVSIGDENLPLGLEDCSIISAEYSVSGRSLGRIGVIGPTRMQYSKVISILMNIVKEMDKGLSDTYDDR